MMNLFSFSGWKKKALRFTVKSAIGRFLKEVEQHHVTEPAVSRTGLSFGLERLEVHEDRVNEEILKDAPLRMACGTINSIQGEIAYNSDGVRNMSVEGIDLTFDLVTKRAMRPAATEDEQRQQRTDGRGARDHGSRESKGGMFSSLLGDISEDVIASEILTGNDEGDGDYDERTIDNGVSALSQTIKTLVHSLSLKVSNVNIRIRCPPIGKEIIPNQPLPAGTVELVVSIPNEVTLADHGTNETDVGNSFSKLISFAGIRISIYDANDKKTEMKGDVEIQKMSYSDVILSGAVESVDNQIVLQYQDTLPDSNMLPKWNTDVQLNQLHLILGPSQLLRLSTIAKRLMDAPEVTDNSGRARNEVSQDRSKFKLRCSSMSASVLYDDAREMVANAWRHSATVPIQRNLSVRYYAIRVQHLMLVQYNASLPTEEKDDKHFKVFDRYGGSSVNFGTMAISIVEHRPGYEQLACFSIGDTTTRADSATPRSTRPSLACVIRTTCPLTPRLARECDVEIADTFPTNIVRQDIDIQTRAAIEINFDVEVLERLIKFGKRLEYLIMKASVAEGDTEVEESIQNEEGEEHTTSDGSIRYDSPTGSGAGHTLPTDSSGSSLNHRDFTTTPAPVLYTVLRTVRVDVAKVIARILFPMTRRPSKDLYGPLTQRLFRQVLEHTSNPNSARSTPEEAVSTTHKHWRKTLVVELSQVLLTMPTGDGDHIIIDADEGTIVQLDTVSGEQKQLCKAILKPAATSSRPMKASEKGGASAIGAPSAPSRRQIKTLFAPKHAIEIIRRPVPVVAPTTASSNTSSTLPPQQQRRAFRPDEVDFRTDVSWQDTECAEANVSERSDISIYLGIPKLSAELHQDDLLMLLFMMGELTDCVADALKSLDPIQAEEEEKKLMMREATAEGFDPQAAVTVIPPSGMSVRIAVAQAEVTLFVPRLGADGSPIGEPLWMTLAPEVRKKIRRDVYYHQLVLNAKGLGLFIYSYSPENADKYSSEMAINVRAATMDLLEVLPDLPRMPDFSPPSTLRASPQWGTHINHINSYGTLHNKSHNADRDQTALTLCMKRGMNVGGATNDINILLDRLTLVHRTAYDGDNWLMALLQFVGDAPAVAEVSDDEQEDALGVGGASFAGSPLNSVTGRSAPHMDINPPTIRTRVYLVAKESLLQYQPLGYVCHVAILIPTFVVNVGTIVNTDKRAVIELAFDTVTMYLMNNFTQELLEHDAQSRNQSSFGVTQGGIARDLENIGFVSILSVNSPQKSSAPNSGFTRPKYSRGGGAFPTPTSFLGGGAQSMLTYLPDTCVRIRLYDVASKPIVVEINGLSAQLGCACDSFCLFQTVMAHYLAGLDLQYVPTPEMLVSSMGGKNRSRHHVPSDRDTAPDVKIKIADLAERLKEVLAKSIFDLDKEANKLNRSPTSDEKDFVTFDADGQQVLSEPERRQQEAHALQQAIVDNANREPVILPPHSGDEDDGFEVVGHAEGAKVQRVPGQWAINPALSRQLQEGYTAAAAKENVKTQLDSNASAVNYLSNVPHPADPAQDVKQPFDINAFISNRAHFSLKNETVFQSDDGNAEADARLSGCPSVAAEIRVTDCVCVVRFFGGLDFSGVKADRDYYDALMQTHSMMFYTGDPSNPDNVCFRSTRAQNVSIEAQLFSVSAQVDIFVPGHSKTMQMVIKVRDAHVLDRIEASAVRTILMCSIPPELRDNEGNFFEMKWVSVSSTVAQDHGEKASMEDISIRLQPLVLNIHRRDVDLMLDFINVSQEMLDEVLQIDVQPSTMFFRRLFVHPVSAEIYVRTEATELGQAIRGQASRGSGYEFANLLIPSVEGSKVSLGRIELLNVPMADLGERLTDVLLAEMWSIEKLLLLMCGLEIARTVNEAGQAVGELVIRPLDYYRRNRSLYTGIVKGLSGFSRRIGAETMRVGARTARAAHYIAHSGTSMVTNNPSMARGSQPTGTGDGLSRAAKEVRGGVVEAYNILRFSLYDERGSVLDVPLAPVALTDGMFRAITTALEGVRNSLRPEQRELERRLYKSKLEPGKL